MSKTPEERKAYNAEYYAKHKQHITEILLVRIDCPHCGKPITKTNLKQHTLSASCQKNREQLKSNYELMKEEIEQLKEKLNSLSSNTNL